MYTGFAASDNVNCSPDANVVVKSGAGGPSGVGSFVEDVPGVEESVEGCVGPTVDDGGDVGFDPFVESVASGDADEHAAASKPRTATRSRNRFMLPRYP